MRITVKFHGLLGKLCPGEHTVEANNAYEALRIVCKNNEKKLTRKNGHRFDCFCKQVKTTDDLYKRGATPVLDVMPSFLPAGGGSTKQAWIMTAIIVVVAVIAIACTGGFGSAGLTTTVTTASGETSTVLTTAGYIAVGSALSVSGIWLNVLSQHLQKDKKPDQNETQQNYAFGMNGNTTKVGTAIPIGYGRYRVYGQLLSWGTSTTNFEWTNRFDESKWLGKLRNKIYGKQVLVDTRGMQIKDGTVNQW